MADNIRITNGMKSIKLYKFNNEIEFKRLSDSECLYETEWEGSGIYRITFSIIDGVMRSCLKKCSAEELDEFESHLRKKLEFFY